MELLAAYCLILLLFDWQSAVFFILVAPYVSLNLLPYYFTGVLSVSLLRRIINL